VRYYVIGQDGNKYGPADIATLRQWIAEGRVNPDTWLEEEGSGQRVQSKSVVTPDAPQAPAYTPHQQQNFSQPPGPISPYPRQQSTQGDGQTQFVIGWICAVMSLFCCPVGFGAAAIILGTNAKSKGHPGAQRLITFAIIFLVIGFVLNLVLTISQPSLLDDVFNF
jgi:hypothetical protein